jgi:DNA repair protein RecO (recombination protein O)
LLALPPFLLAAQQGLGPDDVRAGFALTGHFLETHIFGPLNRPLPPARVWLLDRLAEADRE